MLFEEGDWFPSDVMKPLKGLEENDPKIHWFNGRELTFDSQMLHSTEQKCFLQQIVTGTAAFCFIDDGAIGQHEGTGSGEISTAYN